MINLEDYLNEEQIEYFKDSLYLLKNDNYQKFYDGLKDSAFSSRGFTELFLACEINPLKYMTYVPRWFISYSFTESVDIPEGIVEIDADAFFHCRKLKTVKLPSSLEAINEGAFGSCESLKEIEIPENVKYIGKRAFFYCMILKKVRILSKDIKLETGSNFPFTKCPEYMSVEVRTQELADVFKDAGFKNIKIF